MPLASIIFRRALRDQCPRCGHAGLFATKTQLHDRCPHCGLPLEMEDGWSYGAVPLNYILVGIGWVLPVSLLTLFGLLPMTAGIVLGLAGVVVLPFLFYRWTKRLWVGIYYSVLPQEMETRPGHGKGDHHG